MKNRFGHIKEIITTDDKFFQDNINKIDNAMLLNNDRKFKKNKKLAIFPSSYDNFSLKTFVFFSLSANQMNGKIEKEQKELIQGVINQCEIIYLLFNSQYYKK